MAKTIVPFVLYCSGLKAGNSWVALMSFTKRLSDSGAQFFWLGSRVCKCPCDSDVGFFFSPNARATHIEEYYDK